MKKLMLVVIDALRPQALDRAIEQGDAPTLARLARDGHCVRDCISSFPSLTPVASSTITTGTGPDRHNVPSMNWYDREERRYVDYGSSFQSSRRHGVTNVLEDLVFGLNERHLNSATPTFFETLEAAGLRTACTTYMIYRGPHKHEYLGGGLAGALASAVRLKRPAHGPRHLFYADIFDSLGTDCRSRYGSPGQRDAHAACVARRLIEDDEFDFLLLSMPDNDTHSHRAGPAAQTVSIAHADEQLERVFDAAGGYREFMEDHAVIVLSDHSQSAITRSLSLAGPLAKWDIRKPRQSSARGESAGSDAIAVSPVARVAMTYVLDRDRRDELCPRLASDLLRAPEIDLAMWVASGEVIVRCATGELRFAPGTGARDARGAEWGYDGDLGVLGLAERDGALTGSTYPDAFARIWAALACPNAGDVICTAAPAAEFVDWGGSHHVGGGSHGSLHHDDSEAQLIVTGTAEAFCAAHGPHWSIADVHDLVLAHFGVDSDA